MGRSSNKRERLVAAARDLIHRQGFNQTTLADIAREADVPLGNVYYYFKTKEELAAAVIGERIRSWQEHQQDWAQEPDPRRRLVAFLDRLAGRSETIAAHGCPIGSLCQELDKQRTLLTGQADELLKLQLAWATEQFRLLGRADAAETGQQLLAAVQGTCVLTHALHDPTILTTQITRLKGWLARV